MDTTLIADYKGWIVLIAFVFFFVIERVRPAETRTQHPIRRIVKNISFWPFSMALSLFIILPVTYVATRHALWERPPFLQSWLAIPLDICLLDVFLFWWHRANHEIPFLWRFHSVHHLDEHLDTTSAVRFHAGELFLSVFARALVIMALAIPFRSVIIFEVLVLIATFFHHSNIALSTRFDTLLSRLIITPGIHWVHHHARQQDTDSNYGTIFSIWDPLFRTRSSTQRFSKMKIGVQGQTDQNFWRLLILPFLFHRRNQQKR